MKNPKKKFIGVIAKQLEFFTNFLNINRERKT